MEETKYRMFLPNLPGMIVTDKAYFSIPYDVWKTMTLDIKNKQIMTTSSLEPRLEEVSLEADFLKHQFF